MPPVIEKNYIKIGKEPVVVLPLAEWQEIEDLLEERESFLRYNTAISDPDNQEKVSFGDVKKRLNFA